MCRRIVGRFPQIDRFQVGISKKPIPSPHTLAVEKDVRFQKPSNRDRFLIFFHFVRSMLVTSFSVCAENEKLSEAASAVKTGIAVRMGITLPNKKTDDDGKRRQK